MHDLQTGALVEILEGSIVCTQASQGALYTLLSHMPIHVPSCPGLITPVFFALMLQEECQAAVRLLDEEAERLSRSSGYGLKMLPLPLYAGAWLGLGKRED